MEEPSAIQSTQRSMYTKASNQKVRAYLIGVQVEYFIHNDRLSAAAKFLCHARI
jgi:hypothetical protein